MPSNQLPEDVYMAAWTAKLCEIRERGNSAPVVPYEAHRAGLAAVIEWARKDQAKADVQIAEKKSSEIFNNTEQEWADGTRMNLDARIGAGYGAGLAGEAILAQPTPETTGAPMTTSDPRLCPVHGIPDCSPLLNGCSRLTAPATSDPKVEEIRARLAAATPGPWCHYPEAGTIEIAEGGDEVHSGAILVSSVRPRLGWGADIYTGDEPDAEFIAHSPTDINYLLTKLDEAEKENAKLRGVNRALERRCLDAQGREVTLIAGVKEAICALDLVDVHQYELGSGSVGDIARTLSRLLPSTPTEEGKSHE